MVTLSGTFGLEMATYYWALVQVSVGSPFEHLGFPLIVPGTSLVNSGTVVHHVECLVQHCTVDSQLMAA